MKRFHFRSSKAASIERQFEDKKPMPPGPTKLSEKEKKKMLSSWGPWMGKEFIRIHEERLRRLRSKSKKDYEKRMAEWKKERAAAIGARDASIKRQEEDTKNRYYACSLCGQEASSDSRMGSVDVWSNCEHNDRYIQQRDRRQDYPQPDYYR